MNSVFPNTYLNSDGVPEINVRDAHSHLHSVELIDVRRPDEFNDELGHIAGAQLFTLGPDLMQALKQFSPDKTYVFICRSGVRSITAAAWAQAQGLTKVFNMQGGMMAWNQLGFATEKNS